jgi:hypothetical protein
MAIVQIDDLWKLSVVEADQVDVAVLVDISRAQDRQMVRF